MAAPPVEGGGDGMPEGEDTKMGDDPSEGRSESQPADTGSEETTKWGAFMVVGSIKEAEALVKKLKMHDVEWMPPGRVQRSWYANAPNSPLLERAIAAAAAGKWVIASMERDVMWRYELPGTRPSKQKQGQSPTKPSVMPSGAPQRAAGVTPAGAWRSPLSHTSQRVHPIPLSKEAAGALIKSEIASRLEQYEQQLEAAKAKSKRRKAELKDREAVITGLKAELAALQGQAKSSENAAATSSPPDLQVPPEKQERWAWQREIREVTKEVKEIAQKSTAVQVEQIRRNEEVAVLAQSLSALRRQLDALQQLIAEQEDRRSQRADQSQATQLQPKPRRKGPTGAMDLPPQTFVFGGKVYQQPLPAAPVWPVHQGLGFEPAAPARVAPAELEDAKEPAVERPEPEAGAEREGDEAGAEEEQKPGDVWEVAPLLATPDKLPPAVLDPTVRTTRGRSPGGTPSRGEVLRQNAADRMAVEEDSAAKWAVVVAVPKEVRELSAAEGSEQREAAPLVRRGPLFEDQNFPL